MIGIGNTPGLITYLKIKRERNSTSSMKAQYNKVQLFSAKYYLGVGFADGDILHSQKPDPKSSSSHLRPTPASPGWGEMQEQAAQSQLYFSHQSLLCCPGEHTTHLHLLRALNRPNIPAGNTGACHKLQGHLLTDPIILFTPWSKTPFTRHLCSILKMEQFREVNIQLHSL